MRRNITDLTTIEMYARSCMMSSNALILDKLFRDGLEIDSYMTKAVEGVVRSSKRYRWKYREKYSSNHLDVGSICDSIINEVILSLKNKGSHARHIDKIRAGMRHKVKDCTIVDYDGVWIVRWKFFEVTFKQFEDSNKFFFWVNPNSPITSICPENYRVAAGAKTILGKTGFYSKKEALIFAKKLFRSLKKIII